MWGRRESPPARCRRLLSLLVHGTPDMLDAARKLGILERVVDEIVGHSGFRRKPEARRFAHRLVRFVVSEIERETGTARPPAQPPPSTSEWLDILLDLWDELVLPRAVNTAWIEWIAAHGGGVLQDWRDRPIGPAPR